MVKELAKRILKFLETYARIIPDSNDLDDECKYTSPDAQQLKTCAELLLLGEKPNRCWSEWGSGGYSPYSSAEGRNEHDYLVSEIYKIINK